MGYPLDTTAARAAILDAHEGTLDAILACADRVSADWPTAGASDPDAVRPELATALAAADIPDRLTSLLRDAVVAGGGTLAGTPVGAPPYVVVTSLGPLLRGPLVEGRLVIQIRVFAVQRDRVRYVRSSTTPADAVRVTCRRSPDTL